MKNIFPIAIDPLMLAGDIPLIAATPWSAGTTYNLFSSSADYTTIRGSLGYCDIYQTLQPSNIGHPPASAPYWWKWVGATYDSYDTAVTYSKGYRVLDPTTGYCYESLIDGNVGVSTTKTTWPAYLSSSPPTTVTTLSTLGDGTKWLKLGMANRFLMIDGSNSSQTVGLKSILVNFQSYSADGFAMSGLVGPRLDVKLSTYVGTTETVQFSKHYELDRSVITDPYDWFFTPFDQIDRIAITGLPMYDKGIITAQITGAGIVACGNMIAGEVKYLGGTEHGVSIGIIDYSLKSTDAYGTATVVKRAYSEKLSAKLVFDNSLLPSVQASLVSFRSTPSMWVSTDTPDREPLMVFGFYKDFSIVVDYFTHSSCTLEIEGLT